MGRGFTRLPTIFEIDCDAAVVPSRPSGLLPSLVEPLDAVSSAQHADSVVLCLADARRAYRSKLIAWLLPVIRPLSLAEHGSRVVCQALKVAAGQDRDLLIQELQGSALELSMHKHGYHILVTLIEVMPRHLTCFVNVELIGHVVRVAQDRFACHVLEALVMQHGDTPQMAPMMIELIRETKLLALDFHGNRVLQTIIEYGTLEDRQGIIHQLLPDILDLASRRGFAACVLRHALEYGGEEERQKIASALLDRTAASLPAKRTMFSCSTSRSASLADVANSRWGSELLVQLADDSVDQCHRHLQLQLSMWTSRLRLSKYGRRVARCYGLSDASSCLVGDGAAGSGEHHRKNFISVANSSIVSAKGVTDAASARSDCDCSVALPVNRANLWNTVLTCAV